MRHALFFGQRHFFPLISVGSTERLGKGNPKLHFRMYSQIHLAENFPPSFVNVIVLPLCQIFTWEYQVETAFVLLEG